MPNLRIFSDKYFNLSTKNGIFKQNPKANIFWLEKVKNIP